MTRIVGLPFVIPMALAVPDIFRRLPNHGPGKRTVLNPRGHPHYDGYMLRQIRAERGVGNPNKRGTR